MNICFASLDYPSHTGGGGVGSLTRTLTGLLVERGHQVSVIALQNVSLPEMETDESGVRIHWVRLGNWHWYLSKLPVIGELLSSPVRELERGWCVYRTARRIASQTPIDIIEGTETGTIGLAFFLRTIPLVIRLHGEQFTFYKYTPDLKLGWSVRLARLVQRMALKRARLLISPSVAHAQEVATELGEYAPPLRIVPNCIDPRLLTLSSGEKVNDLILYVGRLERLKGVLTLLAAMRQVIREFPQAQLILAGAEHPTLLWEEVQGAIEKYHLRRNITWLGHIPTGQLGQWYSRAALCILPSFYETFGIAALEPMSLGVPVIVSDRGGLPEVVEDGVSGLIFPAGDVNALAEAIKRLLRNPDERHAMGIAARDRALTKFRPDMALVQTLQCYSDALIRRSPISEMVANPASRHLYFSPHLDDVILSCGGQLGLQIQGGSTATFITVFSGQPPIYCLSAFARHLHAKWRLDDDSVVSLRRIEDQQAAHRLGVACQQWDFLEAPYRLSSDGRPLYCSYAELRGSISPEDENIVAQIYAAIAERLAHEPRTTQLYFPLGLAAHVDHQILRRIGWRLWREGWPVIFYEEWPYLDEYQLGNSLQQLNWESRIYAAPIQLKLQAALCYVSQIVGLGGTPAAFSRRLKKPIKRFRFGDTQAYERVWMPRATEQPPEPPPLPLRKTWPRFSFSQFLRYLDAFRWHDLEEVLPPGRGQCLDVGCGNGRHRILIEERGYNWKGLDIDSRPQLSPRFCQGDFCQLPLSDQSFSAVIFWQSLEYTPAFDLALAEANRVLEWGGVICGSVSFLEPLHGKTYLGLSHLALRHYLSRAGFEAVEIRPGLNGFSLLAWTWFRRWGGVAWGPIGLMLIALWLVPLAFLLFAASWLLWRVGLGAGHSLSWLTETMPLEFAGHLMFVARKTRTASNASRFSGN